MVPQATTTLTYYSRKRIQRPRKHQLFLTTSWSSIRFLSHYLFHKSRFCYKQIKEEKGEEDEEEKKRKKNGAEVDAMPYMGQK